MTPIVKDFFSELEKYEDEGTDSMDWVEWANYIIDEEIVSKFNVKDWNCIKKHYKSKSDKMKSLICGHIHLNEINSAEIQLEILTETIKTEQIDIAYQALRNITFSFITSGQNPETNKYFHEKELKGVFLTEKKDFLIEKFFTSDFTNKALDISKECGDFQKKGILAFLKVLNTPTNDA